MLSPSNRQKKFSAYLINKRREKETFREKVQWEYFASFQNYLHKNNEQNIACSKFH